MNWAQRRRPIQIGCCSAVIRLEERVFVTRPAAVSRLPIDFWLPEIYMFMIWNCWGSSRFVNGSSVLFWVSSRRKGFFFRIVDHHRVCRRSSNNRFSSLSNRFYEGLKCFLWTYVATVPQGGLQGLSSILQEAGNTNISSLRHTETCPLVISKALDKTLGMYRKYRWRFLNEDWIFNVKMQKCGQCVWVPVCQRLRTVSCLSFSPFSCPDTSEPKASTRQI